jgi:hypothetical protein
MTNAPDSVAALVAKFARHADAYRRGRYGETNVRVEFIDPLFIALGCTGADGPQGAMRAREHRRAEVRASRSVELPALVC